MPGEIEMTFATYGKYPGNIFYHNSLARTKRDSLSKCSIMADRHIYCPLSNHVSHMHQGGFYLQKQKNSP